MSYNNYHNQSPIPNPQSPIPRKKVIIKIIFKIINNFIILKILNKLKNKKIFIKSRYGKDNKCKNIQSKK